MFQGLVSFFPILGHDLTMPLQMLFKHLTMDCFLTIVKRWGGTKMKSKKKQMEQMHDIKGNIMLYHVNSTKQNPKQSTNLQEEFF